MTEVYESQLLMTFLGQGALGISLTWPGGQSLVLTLLLESTKPCIKSKNVLAYSTEQKRKETNPVLFM